MLCRGAFCRESEKAFIFAAISDVSPLANAGEGPGRRAALTGPSGSGDTFVLFGIVPSFGVCNAGSFGGAGRLAEDDV
jgi:hypothetical protein